MTDVPDADREAAANAIYSLIAMRSDLLTAVTDAAIAALRERGWKRVPTGWRVMPKVPPDGLIEAMAEAHEGSVGSDLIVPMEDAYRVAIADAPSPPGAEK